MYDAIVRLLINLILLISFTSIIATKMSKEKWFLGHVSRQVAEDAITSCGIDGSFVFRSSESVPGAFALSV